MRNLLPLALVMCSLAQGCASPPAAAGCWVQFEDESKSFALSWHAGDKDPLWVEPNREASARWKPLQ